MREAEGFVGMGLVLGQREVWENPQKEDLKLLIVENLGLTMLGNLDREVVRDLLRIAVENLDKLRPESLQRIMVEDFDKAMAEDLDVTLAEDPGPTLAEDLSMALAEEFNSTLAEKLVLDRAWAEDLIKYVLGVGGGSLVSNRVEEASLRWLEIPLSQPCTSSNCNITSISSFL
jgi:hypothetical protein